MSLVAHHLHPATGPHALFAHARRYLGAIAHRAGRPCRVDPDDLFQEMAVLLLTNAATYVPTRGRPESFAAVQLRPARARLRQTKSVPTEQGGPDDDRVRLLERQRRRGAPLPDHRARGQAADPARGLR